MFDNVGEKIKKDAEKFFIITSVLGAFGAIACLIVALTKDSFASVMGYLIASVILLCVNLFVARLIYGFGVLVEKAESTQRQTEDEDTK